MRHVRDVIRLKSAGMPTREIARRVGAALSTVRLTIRRFEAAGLTWPLPDDMTDAVLEARLFANAPASLGQVAARYATVFSEVDQHWEEATVSYEARKKSATNAIPELKSLPDPAQEHPAI